MTVNLNIVEKCVSCLNIKESYDLARHMEQEKTNPVLGYRTAGSLAERKTGDMLLEEMKKAGLTQVEKDKIRVDAWKFKKAVMRCHDREGTCREIQLGAYQTDFKTNGFQRFDLVYLGKGTADEYKDIDVKGKLVLIEINQREEWWINYPVYQAHLKGAAALIAVQSRGYAQIDDTALNAQDIAGPSCAPAFSMSRADFLMIRQLMEEKNENGNRVPELSVEFDADTEVLKDQYTYNIVGKIPGTDSDSMILLSAHYDSYFEGFQDDNAAVAMIIGIARALLRGGYKPRHTIVVCALAAEEWGISDTKYDWSTGAYRQVFEARPEWQGHVIADLNFELPAHAHSTRDAVRCTYEYADFVRSFVDAVQMPEGIYPEGMTTLYPIETWSDDFSMAIAGIPSTVNDFSAGPFMQNYYHSQYDNQDVYQEPVYRFHHECYLKFIGGSTMHAVAASVRDTASDCASGDQKELLTQLEAAEELGSQIYDWICRINGEYQSLTERSAKKAFREKWQPQGQKLLHIFRKAQDYLVRLNWQDEVMFPQEAAAWNIHQLEKARISLEKNDITDALKALYRVDNNMYAFLFDEEVYYHFTEYILHQPKDRLMWGAGRIMHHENLYGIVQKLKERMNEKEPELDGEIRRLEAALRRQRAYYRDDIRYLKQSVSRIYVMLEEIKGC